MSLLSRPAFLQSEPPSKAQQCRRNAGYCHMLAADADDESRSRLLAMEGAWLALARNEEWLSGTCNPQNVVILPLGRGS